MSDGAQINLGDQDDLVIKHTGTNSEIVGLSTIKILSNNYSLYILLLKIKNNNIL